MSLTMRASLVIGLADYMKSLAASQSHSLASNLTDLVNEHVAGAANSGFPNNLSDVVLKHFPPQTWNELTVGVPWEAYSYAHGVHANQHYASSTLALCSAPDYLDAILAEQASHSRLWGGSLLVSLGKILEGVERDLIVVSPYWRTLGVQSLLSAAGRKSYANVTVTILTQPKTNMQPADRDGLDFFTTILQANDATVRTLNPKSIDGARPFLHAKLIVADGKKAYVGSANFTSSGLDHGLEAGVLVEGKVATDFASWTKAIAVACEPW